jgi:hypothetical protein
MYISDSRAKCLYLKDTCVSVDIVVNGGAGKRTRVAGVKGKHPTHRANRFNPLGTNCNVAHLAALPFLSGRQIPVLRLLRPLMSRAVPSDGPTAGGVKSTQVVILE